MDQLLPELFTEIISHLSSAKRFHCSIISNKFFHSSKYKIVIADNRADFKRLFQMGDLLSLVKSRKFFWRQLVYNRLEDACRSGQREVVDLLIRKGDNDWHGGLIGACMGGSEEIFDL